VSGVRQADVEIIDQLINPDVAVATEQTKPKKKKKLNFL
jgi:hypothetical protein